MALRLRYGHIFLLFLSAYKSPLFILCLYFIRDRLLQQLDKSGSIHPPGVSVDNSTMVMCKLIHHLPYRDPIRQDVFAGAKAENEDVSHKNLAVRQPKQTHSLVTTDIIDTYRISASSTTIQGKRIFSPFYYLAIVNLIDPANPFASFFIFASFQPLWLIGTHWLTKFVPETCLTKSAPYCSCWF